MEVGSTSAILGSMRDWIARNPLRTWRRKNGFGLITAATFLQVGVWSIQQWERGAGYPNEESRSRIKAVCDLPDVDRIWEDWMNSRPTFR